MLFFWSFQRKKTFVWPGHYRRECYRKKYGIVSSDNSGVLGADNEHCFIGQTSRFDIVTKLIGIQCNVIAIITCNYQHFLTLKGKQFYCI